MRSSTSDLPPEAPRVEAGSRDESKEAREEEVYEEGREVEEEEPFEEEELEERVEEVGDEDEDEEEGRLEWPAGVAQASDRDLAKLSHKEGVGASSPALFSSSENTEPSVLPSSGPETVSVARPSLLNHPVSPFKRCYKLMLRSHSSWVRPCEITAS